MASLSWRLLATTDSLSFQRDQHVASIRATTFFKLTEAPGTVLLHQGARWTAPDTRRFSSSRYSLLFWLPGAFITIEEGQDGFFIFTTEGTPCEHPRDYIYMPWGYSPWVSPAPALQPGHLISLLVIFSALDCLLTLVR